MRSIGLVNLSNSSRLAVRDRRELHTEAATLSATIHVDLRFVNGGAVSKCLCSRKEGVYWKFISAEGTQNKFEYQALQLSSDWTSIVNRYIFLLQQNLYKCFTTKRPLLYRKLTRIWPYCTTHWKPPTFQLQSPCTPQLSHTSLGGIPKTSNVIAVVLIESKLM